MRLDKFISHASGLPRARSRQMIRNGNVNVNGSKIKNAAFAVSPSEDIIQLNNEVVSIPGNTYLMIHKPKNVVCANSDSEHATVFDLISTISTDKLSVAGRLDIDTTGLVLASDDGQWIHKIISPKKDCAKTYRVILSEPITEDTIEQFKNGVALKGEDKLTKPAELSILENNHRAVVTISEGRYHQVKRMFAACENNVIGLHREKIGDITLDPSLHEGEYRLLTTEEIQSIHRD